MKFEILPTNCFGFVLSFENKRDLVVSIDTEMQGIAALLKMEGARNLLRKASIIVRRTLSDEKRKLLIHLMQPFWIICVKFQGCGTTEGIG